MFLNFFVIILLTDDEHVEIGIDDVASLDEKIFLKTVMIKNKYSNPNNNRQYKFASGLKGRPRAYTYR